MMETISATNMLSRSRAIEGEIRELRRHIHSHPELSFEENETSKLVAVKLTEYGYKVTTGIGGTGVIADLGDSPRFAIRADMDALPIVEENDCQYKSQTEGVMHACGHDAHTACALGAAKLLSEDFAARKLPGGIRFLFQPAEETVNSEGKSGAKLLIEHGALKDVSALIALHVHPKAPVGVVATRTGPLLAACDSFSIIVKGKGSHGAWPEDGVDAVVVASHLVQSLQTIVSRRKPAIEPLVITVGGIRSSTYRPNIVSEQVELTGIVRYFTNDLHLLAKSEIEKACQLTRSLGADFELHYVQENPPLVNDGAMTDLVRDTAVVLLGKDGVMEIPAIMGGDDFSFYTKELPCCYFALGTQIPGREFDIHTPRFDINEEALAIGTAMLAQCAHGFFKNA
jgi:amidohydrolase